MNMHLTIPRQDVEPRTLADFLPPLPKPDFDSGRVIGLVLTIVLHVVVIGAIVYGGIQIAHDVLPPPIMVSLSELKPETKAPPPPPVPLVQPRYEMVQVPEVNIVTDVPPPITTVVTPVPVVQAPPPPTAPSETQQSYLARLLGYLNRYKRYPAEARSAHIQGIVMLHFVMDKSGHVTTFDINQSSGKPLLDAEALALIQRAQPLPAIPDGFGKDTINAIVPIEFSLR